MRALIASLLFFCLLPLTANAQPAAKARQALDTSINRILSTLRNPDYVNPATRGPLRRQIEDEVEHIFSFTEFSSRTVGPRWKSFSETQKKEFSAAFAELLLNTYLNRITGYNGETMTYSGETVSPNGDRVGVKTILTLRDGKKIPIEYRMLEKNGHWYVFDVIIENISLVKNYRTQFQDILNTATPDQLIARVREKAAQIIAQGQRQQ